MTLEEAIKYAENMAILSHKGSGNAECEQNHRQLAEWLKDYKRLKEQEPCELLIIKSDILLHQDDRKKWMESIKREKESGVIILPPYFKPLLVPNDIEINIEQEPCEDTISRQAVLDINESHHGQMPNHINHQIWQEIKGLPPVTPAEKLGHWINVNEGKWNTIPAYKCSVCGANADLRDWSGESPFCPWCGAKMREVEE